MQWEPYCTKKQIDAVNQCIIWGWLGGLDDGQKPVGQFGQDAWVTPLLFFEGHPWIICDHRESGLRFNVSSKGNCLLIVHCNCLWIVAIWASWWTSSSDPWAITLKPVHPRHCHMTTYKTGVYLTDSKKSPSKAFFLTYYSVFFLQWHITGTDLKLMWWCTLT